MTIWVLLLVGRLHALGVIAHEMAHLPRSRWTWPVRALAPRCAWPVLTTAEALWDHHLRHHRHPQAALEHLPGLRAWRREDKDLRTPD